MSVSVSPTATPPAAQVGALAFGPPVRPGSHRVFTPDDLSGLGRLKPDEARNFLADFARRGVVEPIEDGYRLTERGAQIARGLAGALGEDA